MVLLANAAAEPSPCAMGPRTRHNHGNWLRKSAHSRLRRGIRCRALRLEVAASNPVRLTPATSVFRSMHFWQLLVMLPSAI